MRIETALLNNITNTTGKLSSKFGGHNNITYFHKTMLGFKEPYPGARILVQVFSGYEAKGEPQREEVLTADKTGTFLWSVPPPRETLSVSFKSADRNARTMTKIIWVMKGDPPPEPFDICTGIETARRLWGSDGREHWLCRLPSCQRHKVFQNHEEEAGRVFVID